jgi:hypothetical protein
MNSLVSSLDKNPTAIWYRLLYFCTAIYPVWHLWRKVTNDHVNHWYASAIQALFLVDFALYHLLYSNETRSYIFYVMRDVVLTFTLATCVSLGLLQLIISHPRPNYLHNQNGILESHEDANIICGWLSMFMSLLIWDQLKLHRANVFKWGQKVSSYLILEDYFYIGAAVLTLLSPLPLILTHCDNFADGCHDPNVNATVV